MRLMKKAMVLAMALMLAMPSMTAKATEEENLTDLPAGGSAVLGDGNPADLGAGDSEGLSENGLERSRADYDDYNWGDYGDDYLESHPNQEQNHWSDPYIITREIRPAVKYVPYSAVIRNSNRDSAIEASYTLTQGTLPAGMELRQNGELYGAPMESGSFVFTVCALFESTRNGIHFPVSEATLTLTVNDNTDEGVYYESDIEEGYILSTPIGVEATPGSHDFYLECPADSLFVSEGPFENFVDLWLNGERLVRNQDYVAEAGSTRITVIEQTMQNKAQNGNNTIAAEFHISGDINRNLRITAQNFRLEKTTGENPGSENPGVNPGSSSGLSEGSNSTVVAAVPTGDIFAPGGWLAVMTLSVTILIFSKKKNRF